MLLKQPIFFDKSSWLQGHELSNELQLRPTLKAQLLQLLLSCAPGGSDSRLACFAINLTPPTPYDPVREPLLGVQNDVLSDPISRDIAILSLRYPMSHRIVSVRLAAPQNGAIRPPPGTKFHTDTSVAYPMLQHITR